MNARRIGLIVFDPLYIIEGGRLKRDFLLVDAIAVDYGQLDLARGYAELLCELHDKDPALILQQFDSDFDYLVERGMVSEVPIWGAVISDDVQSKIEDIERIANRELSKKNPYPKKLPDGRTVYIDPLGSYIINKSRADLLRARCIAAERSTSSKQFIPFASGPIQELFVDLHQGDTRVLRVVISNLPVPASDTPWKRILEFAEERETRDRLARLRGWMADMAVSPLTEQQIQDKLEAALADYQAHMNSHRVKTERGTIEVILVAAAEVVEDVIHGKFSKPIKGLFQVFKEDRSLMDAESKSEGRELAFIDSAAARFK